MQKVLVISNRYLDFVGSDNKPVKGTSIQYIEPVSKNGVTTYVHDKIWIKPEQELLSKKASGIIPGQLIELDYSLEGRRVVLSDIIPGELSVDFDSIFNKEE